MNIHESRLKRFTQLYYCWLFDVATTQCSLYLEYCNLPLLLLCFQVGIVFELTRRVESVVQWAMMKANEHAGIVELLIVACAKFPQNSNPQKCVVCCNTKTSNECHFTTLIMSVNFHHIKVYHWTVAWWMLAVAAISENWKVFSWELWVGLCSWRFKLKLEKWSIFVPFSHQQFQHSIHRLLRFHKSSWKVEKVFKGFVSCWGFLDFIFHFSTLFPFCFGRMWRFSEDYEQRKPM